MSQPGLEGTIDLNIRAALAQVDRLEEALTRATTDVRVTADARGVTAAIDAAVQNAATDVRIAGDASDVAASITAAVENSAHTVAVTGDATDLTGDVTAAIEAADTAVVVTGDASELTGDITAAVDAADTNVVVTGDASDVAGAVDSALQESSPFGPVAVEGQVDPGLKTDILNLGANIADASDEGRGLGKVLAGLGAAAVVKGLFEMAQAASDLAESSSKAAVVFGESFGTIETFADEAATSLGLSKQAALEATGTFGNLFQALDVTQEAAAELSPKVVQLAGDLASFNNLGVDETLEKLRSGLVGEIEPLRSLGVSFNAAQVEAKAVELGLASLGEEVSEGAKVQARFALIMEQTALAQGDFARTSEGLANQQRILRAEFDNAVASVGQALLPALLELVDVTRGAVIPAFQDFATQVLPPLASILVDLAPLLGSTVQLFTAGAPVIAAFARVVDAIPAPLIAAVGALVLLNRVSQLDGLLKGQAALTGFVASVRALSAASGVSTAAAGLAALQTSTLGLTGSLAALGPLAIPIAIGFEEMGAAAADAREAKARLREVTEGLASTLNDENGILQANAKAIRDFVLAQDDEKTQKFRAAIVTLGLDLDTLTEQLATGKTTGQEWADQLLDAADKLQGEGNLADEINTVSIGLAEMRVALETNAAASIVAAQSSGALSAAQAQQALESENVIGAYNALLPIINEHNAALAATEARYASQIAAAEALGTAYITLKEGQLGVIADLRVLAAAADDPNQALTNLVLGLNEAELSEEQMGAAAALLGTDVATLARIIDATAQELDDFVSAAVGGLPTIGDAFKPAEKGAQRTASATRDVAKETRDMERAIRDAERGIVQANLGVEDSLDALNDAYGNVEDAIEGVTEAQERLADAEEALRRAREGPSPWDLEEGEINVEEARIAAERATLRIQEAEERLADARKEGDPLDVRQAELDLENARLSARTALFAIDDAEQALQETRAKGSDQDAAVVAAQDAVTTAYEGVTEAQDRVVEANDAVVKSQLAVEEATYRVVTAQEALVDAQTRTIDSGGGVSASVEKQNVTLSQFVSNLKGQSAAISQFLEDLDTIARAGGTDLAATLAEQGLEAGGGFARELAKSVKGGTSKLVDDTEKVVDDANDVLDGAEQFFRADFGPRYIAASKLVADLAAKGFGSKLTIAEQTRIAMRLADSQLDADGRKIALIAATVGDKAARDYASKFKIDAATLTEGLAVAHTLQQDKAQVIPAAGDLADRSALSWGRNIRAGFGAGADAATGDAKAALDRATGPTDAARTLADRTSGSWGHHLDFGSGVDDAGVVADDRIHGLSHGFLDIQAFISGGIVGRSFTEGLTAGIENNSDDERDPLIRAARQMIRDIEAAARDEAHSRSPSQVFADLGADLIAGLVEGIDDSVTEAEAAATAAIDAVTAAVAAGFADLPSPDLTVPISTTGAPNVAALARETAASQIMLGTVVPGAVATGGGFGTTVTIGQMNIEVTGAVGSVAEARQVARAIESELVARLTAEREFAVAVRAEGF